MNERIGSKWIQELESGRYRKGSGHLHVRGGTASEDAFCCLGVLCQMAVAEGVAMPMVETQGPHAMHDGQVVLMRYGEEGSGGQLPREVQEWAEMVTPLGQINRDTMSWTDLAAINDQVDSFSPIVTAIRKHLRDL